MIYNFLNIGKISENSEIKRISRKKNGLKEKLQTKLVLAIWTSQRKTQSKREEHDNGG